MANWLQRRFLAATIQSARNITMATLGAKRGNEIDSAALMLLEVYLWGVLFYTTDSHLGTGSQIRRAERVELVMHNIRKLSRLILNRAMPPDQDQEWTIAVTKLLAQFERFVTSHGGQFVLCKPVLSQCVRGVMVSEDLYARLFPTDDHRRAFDLAAAHGAVHLLNRGGRSNTFGVIDEPAPELDLEAPDIFMSYASENRNIAMALSDSLNSMRVATWFDRTIPAGSEFHRTIDAHIQTAKLVMVLWSPAAVMSQWVQAEALYGFNMQKLVAVMIEHCSPPVPFNAIQSIWWLSDRPHTIDKWVELMGVIGPRIGRPGLKGYMTARDNEAHLAVWKHTFPDDPLART